MTRLKNELKNQKAIQEFEISKSKTNKEVMIMEHEKLQIEIENMKAEKDMVLLENKEMKTKHELELGQVRAQCKELEEGMARRTS